MTDTPKKPKRTAIYIEEHPVLVEWIGKFKNKVLKEQGYTPTSKQGFAAFLKLDRIAAS